MNLSSDYLVKRIINNAIVNWVTKFIIALSAIILTPILISGLGKYEYGIWVLIGQIISFLLIADLGVANTVCRLISKYDAVENEQMKLSTYSSSMFIFSFVMITVVFVALILLNYLPGILNVQQEYETVSKHVFLIMAVNIVVIFPLRIGRGLLQSKHRFDYIDIFSSGAKIFQLVVIISMYYLNNISLISLAWVIAIINTLAEIAMFVKAKNLNKGITFKASTISVESLKEILSLGGASLLQTLSSAISRQGMILIVGIMLGVLYAPLFSIPLLLLLSVGPLIGRIGTTFMPIASAYDSREETKKILKLSVYGTRYTFMLGLLVAVYIFLYGKELLGLWLPDNEISSSEINVMYTSLLIVILPFVLARSNQGNRVILLSTGNHWVVSNTLLISSVAGIILAFLLVKFTALSLYGVVVGWVAKLLFGDYLMILYFLVKKYSVEIIHYLQAAYVAPLLTVIPIIVFSIGLKSVFHGDTFMQLIVGTLFYFIISIVCVYALCIKKQHIEMVVPTRFKSVFKF